MAELKEVNLEEMSEVAGGKISFEKRPDKKGWIQHKVTGGGTNALYVCPLCGKQFDTLEELTTHPDCAGRKKDPNRQYKA